VDNINTDMFYEEESDGYDTDSSRYYYKGDYYYGSEVAQDHIARWGDCRNWDRYNEEWGYCEGMETLQEKLKAATLTLMSPNEDAHTQIEVGSFGSVQGTARELKWRDVISCPSLQPFVDALKNFPEDRALSIKLNNFQLKEGVLTKFQSCNIETKQLICLDIDITHLSGLDAVTDILQVNTTLEKLKLTGAILSHQEPTNRFVNVVKNHPSLELISLDNCTWSIFGQDSTQQFSTIMEGIKDIRKVILKGDPYMHGCEVGIKEIHRLPAILATNPLLQEITLDRTRMSYNSDRERHIGDRVVKIHGSRESKINEALVYIDLAEALATNTNLKQFIIPKGGDCIWEEGIDALWKAVYDDTSLNSIAESNHTCIIKNQGKNFHQPWTWDRSPFQHIALGSNLRALSRPGWTQGLTKEDSRESSKESKLRYALGAKQKGNLNIHYLNEVPLSLMPQILSFVQPVVIVIEERIPTQVPTEKEVATMSLKNVFEVMKNCVAPLLDKTKVDTLKRKRDV